MFKGIYVVRLKTIKRELCGESQTIRGTEMQSEPCRMPPCLLLSPHRSAGGWGGPPSYTRKPTCVEGARSSHCGDRDAGRALIMGLESSVVRGPCVSGAIIKQPLAPDIVVHKLSPIFRLS